MPSQYPTESRLYTRVNCEIPVSVFYNGQLIGRRVCRNIGIGGVLIKTEDLGLPHNALVEIEIYTMVDVSRSNMRIPGVVTRIEQGFIAIEFERLDKDAEAIIKNAYC